MPQRGIGLQPKVAELARLPWVTVVNEFNRNAVVASSHGRADSIPNVFLVPFDLVLAQQRAQLVLEANLAVMLLLPGDVLL